MRKVMVVVRRNPCDVNYEAHQIGFMEEGEGLNLDVLKDSNFGFSTVSLFKLIGFTPQRVMKLSPDCCSPHQKLSWWLKRSLRGWDSTGRHLLGLFLSVEEFQRLANIVGFPILLYTYDPSYDKDVQFVMRIDLEASNLG